MHIERTIHIEASPAILWPLLTDPEFGNEERRLQATRPCPGPSAAAGRGDSDFSGRRRG